MQIRTSMKSVVGAAALAAGVGGLVTQAVATISGPPTPRIITGTPNAEDIYGGLGNDTITGGKGADWIYDPWGTNRFKFFLGDVPGGYGGYHPTEYVYGSGNDRADFYFPIKGRVYLCGGYGGPTTEIISGGPTIVVYDFDGGRYQMQGVKYLYEITPTGPRSVNYLEAPPDPYCSSPQ